MRCADCILECVGRSPLGGCPNGERSSQPAGSETREEIAERIAEAVAYLKSHGWVSVESSPDLEIKNAASALVDAVERYVAPKPGDKYCSRTEILNAKENLKKLISND